jgi:hypothetical protein
MKNIFIDSDEEFEKVASLIYNSLGINNYQEGDSQNVLGGYYYSFSVFGMNIKLELNSYDYEAEYRYMINVNENYQSSLKDLRNIEVAFFDIVLKLLENNLAMAMAIEKDGEIFRIKS